MASNSIQDSAIKDLQKSVRALELQHNKIENLSATVASSVRALESSMNKALVPLGKRPIEDSDVESSRPRNHGSAPVRLEFPLYGGDDDPLVWLLRCESYFRNAGTSHTDRVPLAAHHLVGDAQLWFHTETADRPFPSWAVFKQECRMSFGPPRSLNALGELKQLSQGGRPIDEYINEFRTLLVRASTVLCGQRVDLFTGGLDEVLRIDVELSKPRSLNEAINAARDFSRKSRLLGLSDSAEPENRLPPRPPIKYLTPAEKADRDAKKLCYNCDERFVDGHKCKRLFLLWTLDEKPQSTRPWFVTGFKLEVKLALLKG